MLHHEFHIVACQPTSAAAGLYRLGVDSLVRKGSAYEASEGRATLVFDKK